MIRRLIPTLALVASVLLVASPALGATAYHLQERGAGLSAAYSNVEFDEEGNLPPGDYAETIVDAASTVSIGASTYADYVCIFHFQFTIDGDGNWADSSGFKACGDADSLSIDRKLSRARVVASYPVEECIAWDEETGECLEMISLGDLSVDLSLVGSGDIERVHGVWTGGAAGLYQYAFSGTGSVRAATVSGTLSLDGASLIESATQSGGSLFRTQTGYVDVSH